jgi:hypothetical protein
MKYHPSTLGGDRDGDEGGDRIGTGAGLFFCF